MPLIKPLEDNPHVSVIEFSSQATPSHRAMTLVVVPIVIAEQGATETLRRQARWWEGLVKISKIGPQTLKRVFQRSRDTYSEAARAAGVNRRQLTAEESVLVQKDLNLTHGGLRQMGVKLAELGRDVRLATQKSTRAAIVKWSLKSGEYFEDVPLAGKQNSSVMCLVYASSATEAGARDLDRAVNNAPSFSFFIGGCTAGFITGFAICVLLKETPTFNYARYMLLIASYKSAKSSHVHVRSSRGAGATYAKSKARRRATRKWSQYTLKPPP